ncbi:hypothetical protein [Pseudomonas asplenii]|uniref:hypothetical protein n=1 Tax=Pseudomonas asplenii TaxID=53407 RepID=UPI0003FFA82C|nr:hypothetical protein [Pseudomonas asplenii]UZE27867.1 haloacid dehalogenase [Pseudomonas asplenii]
MSFFRPRYMTLDCYGTLTPFKTAALTCELFADCLPVERMEPFIKDQAAYRFSLRSRLTPMDT